MKKIYPVFITVLCLTGALKAQNGYRIQVNFKGCTDSNLFIARYFWDQVPLMDSCKRIKNGKVEFKGDMALDNGVYLLVNQNKNSFYCQFIVDKNQNFTINLNASDISGTLRSPDDKQNDEFFSYVRFVSQKNKEMSDFANNLKGKPDSAAKVGEKQLVLDKEVKNFDAEFLKRNKGLFVNELMGLKAEHYAPSVPAGADEQAYKYYYYRDHYFDAVNFKDDRVICTPFFADKIKRYVNQLTPQHPDSIIKAMDRILMQCEPGSTMFNTLVGHFTYKYETDKAMSFDQYGKSNTMEKVFIHLADKYIISGKTNGYYSDETVKKIKERVDILRNLLPGAMVPDFYAIDTANGDRVRRMGFDTATTSGGATYLYNKNAAELNQLFKKLYDVKAKYTILVFWAEDCGHCQTEVPKLSEDLKAVKGKIDFKVFAVQTKDELYKNWKKFIVEKKLTDFIHVFDPVHVNNLKERFDIQGTPVIFLLDKEKRIIGKKLATENVVDILNKLEEIEKNAKKNTN